MKAGSLDSAFVYGWNRLLRKPDPMNIYQFDSYVRVLDEMIQLNTHVRGYKSQLATAAKCQNSYFSLILSQKAELSVDQASSLADFWEFNRYEAEYFINLVMLARASSASLKKRVEERLKDLSDYSIKNAPPKIIADLWTEDVKPEDKIFYLQNWFCPAIRALLHLPEMREPGKIAEYLSLPQALVEGIIQRLLSMKLLKVEGDSYIPTDRIVKVLNNSEASLIHEALHERAKVRNALGPENNVRYSFQGTTSRAKFDQFKAILRETVASQLKLLQTDDEPEETLVGVCYDIFEV